jgi:hypothetical protein
MIMSPDLGRMVAMRLRAGTFNSRIRNGDSARRRGLHPDRLVIQR